MTVTLIATPSLCRICFWRRTEIALRIDPGIENLELRSTASRRRSAFIRVDNVVACFGSKWNSAGINKTLYFNTLECLVRGSVDQPDAAWRETTRSRSHEPIAQPTR